MSIRAKILIGALAGAFMLLAIAGIHFFPDVKDSLLVVVGLCNTIILGLGINHMSAGDQVAPPASNAQGGFHTLRFTMLLALLALLAAALSACTGVGAQVYSGYEAAAVKGVKAADDNVVKTLKDATCAVPYGAVQRDAVMTQIAKLACGELPSAAGGLTAADLEALRKMTNPGGVRLTFPASSASAPQ